MYFHAGQGNVINAESVIGIFDLDETSQSYITREFLKKTEQSGNIINSAEDIPKTFIVCCENNKNSVYLCQPAPNILVKRADSGTL